MHLAESVPRMHHRTLVALSSIGYNSAPFTTGRQFLVSTLPNRLEEIYVRRI